MPDVAAHHRQLAPIAVGTRKEGAMAHGDSLTNICVQLVEQLDNARSVWLQRLPEEAAKRGVRVVNSQFRTDIKVDMRDEDTGAFPFRGVDGETVEAGIIGLQMLNALAFATARRHLADFKMIMDFTGALATLVMNKPRWEHAGAVLKANMIAKISVDSLEESISTVFAHYLMNDRTRSTGVVACEEWLKKTGINWLGGMTRMGAAMAFSDYDAWAEMMASAGGSQ